MKMKKIVLVFCVLYFTSLAARAQEDSSWQDKPALHISGFIDVFYIYDFNQPQSTSRQPFLFNHNRHNEFNVNLALMKLAVKQAKYRANFALQAGTYANDNYAAEPGLLKNIFEANIGISLNKQNNLWLDAGVFSSHLGFESAISMDNLTLTRSLAAESSPYFLSGVKLTYTFNDKLEIAGLIVNGWQRIQRLPGNSMPSFGTQVIYRPTLKVTLNWNTFIGTDDPDPTRRIRFFNNFYGQFQMEEKFTLLAGFDIGMQQEFNGASTYEIWFVPTIIGQYSISNTWKASVRAEYYQDESGVIIATATPNGFKTLGLSLNFDYSPTQNIMCRLEGRFLNSQDNVFENTTGFTNNNFFIGTSVALKIAETKIN